jgi:hypothetical protein
MVRYQARLLDSQYSKSELRRLLLSYRTPLGRKSVSFINDLVNSSMQRAELKVQNGLAEALAQLRPLVRRVPSADEPEVQPNQDGPAEGQAAGDGTGKGPAGPDESAL